MTAGKPQGVGPVVLPGAGHFLQWERADVLNPLLVATFGDLRH
jgi:pimeloyl-ACP methyl ester carboxylesterase